MSTKETMIKLIQEAVDGCAENWAKTIAEYLMEKGTYIPALKPITLTDEERLTDARFLNGWHESEEEDIESIERYNASIEELYQRLGMYENFDEDGLLMAFKPIETFSEVVE